jgi:hypothetical protein
MEFKCIRDSILPVLLDTFATDAHVGDVERSICTIKERCRSTIHGLPYSRLPKLMIIELVLYVTQCLNEFPPDGGVSSILSPDFIVTGKTTPDYKHLQV